MSAIEMKEAITRLIDTDNEEYLAEILDYAKSMKEGSGELLPHETPEFLAELDQMDADIDAGRERTHTREEMNEMLRRKTAV